MRHFTFIALAVAVASLAFAVRGQLSSGGIATAVNGGAASSHSKVTRADSRETRPGKPVRRGPVLGSEPHTYVTLLDVRRTGRTMSAKLLVALDRRARAEWLPEFEGKDGRWYTAEGLRVIDEVNGREHFPLVDADGGCYCSNDIQRIDPGQSIGVYARFPAPPRGVDRVSLHVPGFPSFDDLPLAP